VRAAVAGDVLGERLPDEPFGAAVVGERTWHPLPAPLPSRHQPPTQVRERGEEDLDELRRPGLVELQ
jgi:hypothetical protein